MLKKLAIIGLTTALIGCGTSNRVLADSSIFTQGNPIDYGKIFNEQYCCYGYIVFS